MMLIKLSLLSKTWKFSKIRLISKKIFIIIIHIISKRQFMLALSHLAILTWQIPILYNHLILVKLSLTWKHCKLNFYNKEKKRIYKIFKYCTQGGSPILNSVLGYYFHVLHFNKLLSKQCSKTLNRDNIVATLLNFAGWSFSSPYQQIIQKLYLFLQGDPSLPDKLFPNALFLPLSLSSDLKKPGIQ